jgi:ferrous iron transport protein B
MTPKKTEEIQQPSKDNQTYPIHHAANLRKMGVDMRNWDYVVALAGNPNTGKSTIFNALTGLRQHTGNWPGKTVTRAEGGFVYAGARYKLVDLPGTYSLLAISEDEELARDFILFGQPDVTVIVLDVTTLERNLNLALQVLEITDHVVIALNMMDEARRHHLQVDYRCLARDLGVPVVPTCKPHRIQTETPALKRAVSELAQKIDTAYPYLPNARWVALRLLDGDQRIAEALRSGELGDLSRGSHEQSNSKPT